MAKRAALIALGVTLLAVLVPVAFVLGDTGETTLAPPAGELVVAGLWVVFVYAVAVAITYSVLWRKQRQIRANR